MQASALWLWWLRRASKHPTTWLVAAALVLLVPLARALSPFPALGIDPSWDLARGWALPVGLAGVSAALSFLSRHAELLERLAPNARWMGEMGTLVAVPALLHASLAVGAALGAPAATSPPPIGAIPPAVAWTLGCGLLNVHLAAVAVLLLRVPMGATLRIAGLWSALWLIPGLLGSSLLSPILDANIYLNVVERLTATPRMSLLNCATLIASVLGLMLLGRILPPARTAPGVR